MNALDELEALSDSMESLNSCCSSDNVGLAAIPAATSLYGQQNTADSASVHPLLLDETDDSDSGSTDDNTHLCTPIPSWIKVITLL